MKIDNAPETANQVNEVSLDTIKPTHPAELVQKIIPKAETAKNQLQVGDKVKFYNYGFNDYIKGVIKEIKGETIIVEYESFGKMKTEEVHKSDFKKL